MTLPLWCLLGGVLLPYIWAGVSVPFRAREFGDVDLKQPRVQGDQLTGQGARVWGAQFNAWEALAVFAVANLIAITLGADPAGSWSTAAVVWLVARILHGVFYVIDIAPLRIFSFVTGVAMSLWIVWIAAHS